MGLGRAWACLKRPLKKICIRHCDRGTLHGSSMWIQGPRWSKMVQEFCATINCKMKHGNNKLCGYVLEDNLWSPRESLQLVLSLGSDCSDCGNKLRMQQAWKSVLCFKKVFFLIRHCFSYFQSAFVPGCLVNGILDGFGKRRTWRTCRVWLIKKKVWQRPLKVESRFKERPQQRQSDSQSACEFVAWKCFAFLCTGCLWKACHMLVTCLSQQWLRKKALQWLRKRWPRTLRSSWGLLLVNTCQHNFTVLFGWHILHQGCTKNREKSYEHLFCAHTVVSFPFQQQN